jgi:uncharacterized protein
MDRSIASGVFHRPETANGDAFVLTHGAGTNADAPLLVRMAEALAEGGYLVLRYNLPFRIIRPKGPPIPAEAARDREGVVHAAAEVRSLVNGRVFAAGHSYGGRQSAMAAAETAGLVDGLLLLAYPLHPPKKPEKKRTGFLSQLHTPALFVHGTADPFGSIAELREAMALIPARTGLVVVEGAAHDLKRAPEVAAEILGGFATLLS